MRIRLRAALAALLSLGLLLESEPATPFASAWLGGFGIAQARGLASHTTLAVSAPTRIEVKEPRRVRVTPPSADMLRPKVAPGVRAHGVHVPGPHMLAPSELARIRTASAHAHAASGAAHTTQSQRRPNATVLFTVPPIVPNPKLGVGTRSGRTTQAVQDCTGSSAIVRKTMMVGPPPMTPTPCPTDTPTATPIPTSAPTATPTTAPTFVPSGTGINPWWRYQEQNVPGGGHLMVNLGTGNLLLQDDDMSVPHKGVAMAFRRTYNSQSAPTFSGDLQTYQTMYGNGWTNTFDAHLIRTSPGHFSVFDIDGARYDYITYAGHSISGPPGDHSHLDWDGSCGIMWTKKSGTIYYFYNVNSTQTPCPAIGTMGGYAGRLYQIIGRNANTFITFTYAWDNGDASVTGKVSGITATTESGLATTLAFGDVNGHRLLQTLTYPDAVTTVQYGYDANGNLLWVSRPPNNSAGTRPAMSYGYQLIGGNPVIEYAASPRWCQGSTSGCGYDGSWLFFAFTGASAATSTLSEISHPATVNPNITDGTNAPLIQKYAPDGLNYSIYNTEYYTTGVPTPTFRDTDGHMTNWVVDGAGRPSQTQQCTASTSQGQQCTGSWLVTNEAWDADNNLSSETDARGNETDYAYDANGNTIAAAEPAPYGGAFRPTHLLSYDAYNNVTASCDPVATHSLGLDWTSPPTPPPGIGLCPTGSTLATRMQWNTGLSYEPFGEITSLTTPGTAAAPNGYVRTYSFDPSRQGGTDYGLPTSVVGGVTSDNGRQPRQDFWYDPQGNLACYSSGSGQWIMSYDQLGRVLFRGDPDDASHSSSYCTKTGAQPGWSTWSATSYYPDGQVQFTQSASQSAAGTSTSFTYDLDGNEQSETHHYGCLAVSSCTPGVTQKWYDGADRLVEVSLPYDGWDIQGYPWMTRYIYDLSKGGTTNYQGMNLSAYGNLVMTEQFLSGTVFTPYTNTLGPNNTPTPLPISSGSWQQVRATRFDALDRATAQFEAAFGNQPKVSDTYDASAEAGLLSSEALATGELKTYSYDGDGRKTDVTYSNGGAVVTPNVHFDFDADGRPITKHTSALGDETLQYDGLGMVTGDTKPLSLGGATVSYDYYEDGTRKDLNFNSSSYSVAQLYRYSYRTDGKRTALTLSNGTSFQWTYTTAGRLLTQTDPLTGKTITPDSCYSRNLYGSCTLLYYPQLTYAPYTLGRDSYGRVQSVALPETPFTYSAMTYDLEDGIAQQNETSVQNNSTTTQTLCLASTVRDAKPPLSIGPYGSCASTAHPAPAIYGPAIFAYYVDNLPSSSVSMLTPWMLDARAGQLKSWSVAQPDGNPDGSQYSYDLSGRLVGDNEQIHLTQMAQPSGGDHLYSTGTRTKAYDAENRIAQQTSSLDSGTNVDSGGYWRDTDHQPYDIQSIAYDADGHPSLFALTNTPNATSPNPMSFIWLWDGSDRLAECRNMGSSTPPACGAGSFSIEGLGEYNPSGSYTAVYDRDASGAVVTKHDGYGFDKWTSGLRQPGVHGVSATAWGPGSQQYPIFTQYDGKLTVDGWTLDNNTWQGVRTFDASIGQWNTPDAYAGDVHDPMSQQPYMWNRNNPYTYSDPSGFDTRENEAIEAELLMGEETVMVRAQLRLLERANRASSKLENLRRDLSPKTEHEEVPGGTAGAIRNELKTGKPTAGKFHLNKGREYIGALQTWLNENPNASQAERDLANRLLNDLKNAYGNSDPNQFTPANNAPPPQPK